MLTVGAVVGVPSDNSCMNNWGAATRARMPCPFKDIAAMAGLALVPEQIALRATERNPFSQDLPNCRMELYEFF